MGKDSPASYGKNPYPNEMEQDANQDRVESILGAYREDLLRTVAQKLIKPRSLWPVEELIARCKETLNNPPMLDRRLKELPPHAQELLAFLARFRSNNWGTYQLIRLSQLLFEEQSLETAIILLDHGLLLPLVQQQVVPVASWKTLLESPAHQIQLWLPPPVRDRAIRMPAPNLPKVGQAVVGQPHPVRDGFDWMLAAASVWAMLQESRFKKTTTGSLYKRDWNILDNDPVIQALAVESQGSLPEAGWIALHMARHLDLLTEIEQEFHPKGFGSHWQESSSQMIARILEALSFLTSWDPLKGFTEENLTHVGWELILTLVLLSYQEHDTWLSAQQIQEILDQREYDALTPAWYEALLLGLGASTGLVEWMEADAQKWFQLSELGRKLVMFGPMPGGEPQTTQPLVVQPNGAIILYRQGLTPELISKLTRMAKWQTVGPACTLELTSNSVYHGLEAGLTQLEMHRVLKNGTTYPVPENVLHLIDSWAGQRDRIAVYDNATLLEFSHPSELEAALEQGLISVRLSDRFGITTTEPDYSRLRLLGNRDYGTKTPQCVVFDSDGVTFTVLPTSDLLLEAELLRLAVPMENRGNDRIFRMTPAIVQQFRAGGGKLEELEQWSKERTGHDIPPAVKVFFNASDDPLITCRTMMVVSVPDSTTAEGLLQWPETKRWISERLGPTSFAVSREFLQPFQETLATLGITCQEITSEIGS
ncbi:MAG: helicase-associated domain-containing protein [Zavarzinella sp.]